MRRALILGLFGSPMFGCFSPVDSGGVFESVGVAETGAHEEGDDDGSSGGEGPSGSGPGEGEGSGEGPDDTGDPGLCGNGTLDPGEDCDGEDLGGETCAGQGFDGGALGCADDCSAFDTAGCTGSVCGNGIVEGSEACDGAEVGDATCMTEGFTSGSLGCATDCTALETRGCGTCGNATIDGDEACDGAELAGQDCASRGFDSGTLSCAMDCSALDSSGCGLCGNDIVENDEVCDGAVPGGVDCGSLGLGVGAVTCSNACVHDTGACVAIETVSFPLAADPRFNLSGGLPWNQGDWYEGTRTTTIGTTNAIDIHLVVITNGLSACGFQTAAVSIDGVVVGTFTIMQGDTVIDESFNFASIAGPTYTIRYETTASVAPGCGAAGYGESGSTVTFYGG